MPGQKNPPQPQAQGPSSADRPLEREGSIFEEDPGATPAPKHFWHHGENLLLTFFFAFMMVLPLLDILGRKLNALFSFIPANIVPGSLSLVQHTVLAIMMIGGAIAAREGKLLALAATAGLIPERYKTPVRILTYGFGSAITLYLAVASYSFALIERDSGDVISLGIPTWIVLCLLPLGFSLIVGRLIWRSSDKMLERLYTLVVTVLLASLGFFIHNPPQGFILLAFLLLISAVILGAPVFVALGGAALFFLWNSETPISSIPAETYRMVVNPTIPTIPLFTLTGYFLAEGGASKRLLRVFQALFGSMKGGPAIVTCLVCAFFTSFTGGSGVTILALGGLLMPILIAEKYTERNSLGLLTSAGSLGLLFPPSLPVILYGVVSHTPIDKLFLGGILPGVLLVLGTAAWGVWKGSSEQAARHSFKGPEALRALWAAKWELALPLVVFFFLFVVKVTLVESAALTALYAFIVEVFIYRGLRFSFIPTVITECGILVGGVLLILGVSLGFTNDMVDAQIPARLAQWVSSTVHAQWLFLLMVNVLLLLVGGLLEIFAAIIVVVPLLVPISNAFGVDPVHMGIIFLANMELGFLTPPLGLNLFLSSYRFKKPMVEVYKSVLPMLAMLYAMVLLITYVPFLTTWLPKLFSR
jgi:tripartite ATP-independent transporter DctM subunit